MSLLDHVLARLPQAKRDGDWYTTFCPVHEPEGAHNGHHASLRVMAATEVEDGVIMACMAGCAAADLRAALGLSEVGIKPTSDANTFLFWASTAATSGPVATYDYSDENGGLLFQKLRYAPKRFVQRAADGTYKLDGVRRVLYHLPEVVAAASEGRAVFVCEGEKAADAVRGLGFTATCAAAGAGKWRSEYADSLKGARVAVLPDNDEQGRKHGEIVIAALRRAAVPCCVVKLPGLPEKGDPYDAVRAGLTNKELRALTTDAFARREEAVVRVELREARQAGDYNESWLAGRFTDRFGELVVQVPEQGKLTPAKGLRVFSDGVFVQDRVLLMQLAETTVLDLYEAALSADERERKLLRLAASRYDKSDTLGSLLTRVALRVPRVTLEEFDQDPDHLCCANGVADLRSGELLPHDPSYRWTVKTRAAYDPDARCPVWDAHLDKVIENPDEVFALQRLLGYALTGYTGEQVMALAIGTGANGKSVTFNAVAYALGGYATDADAKTFSVRGNDAIREDIAKLREKRFVTSFERHHRKMLDEAFIKKITGGDKVHGCFKYEHEFEFTPQFKVFLSVNDTPSVEVVDFALMRRLLFIPFSVTIPRHEWDIDIDRKLKAEADGILAWMVRGAVDYLREGFQAPERWLAASEQYKQHMDPLYGFAELLTVEDGVWTSVAAIHAAMVRWAAGEGLKTPPSREAQGHWLAKLPGAHAKTRKIGGRLVRGWNVVLEGADIEQTMGI